MVGDTPRRPGIGYLLLALAVGVVALAGYGGYVLYPRFDLPAVEGAALLGLAAAAGLGSFFSPCSFPLLVALLGRAPGADSERSGPPPLRFAGALAASFLPGLPGLLATGLAGALLFAYVLQGLAVIHVYSRGMPMRVLLLATVYLGILLLGWVAILVAILGLAEPLLGLRQRASPGGRPPNSGGTI